MNLQEEIQVIISYKVLLRVNFWKEENIKIQIMDNSFNLLIFIKEIASKLMVMNIKSLELIIILNNGRMSILNNKIDRFIQIINYLLNF
jgi:hypothetical protein